MSVFESYQSLPEGLERHYAEAAPQKDCLCGAFWGALALRSFGITDFDSDAVDQDRLAVECGVALDSGDPYESLPPGAEPRIDYRLELAVAEDRTRAGTAAHSLRSAIARCSGGVLAPVPVRGPWTERSVIDLFRVVEESAENSLLIANYRTSFLWGTRPQPSVLLSYLAGQEPQGPPPEWNVGHYVALQYVVVRGARGLVGVLDTYPSLGFGGHHLQPASAIADALTRATDNAEGGVLCVVRSGDETRLGTALDARGFILGDWDNCSDGS